MERFKTFCIILVFIVTFSNVNCANILFYFGCSIHSHKVAVWPLVLKLAEKGHQITFLSPPEPNNYPDILSRNPHPNVIEFHPKALVIYWKEKESRGQRDVISSRIKGFSDGQAYWDGVMQTALEVCRVIFRSLEVQSWVERSKFDLIIIDTPHNECALGLAYKFQAPYILFGVTSMYMWHQEMFGLPDEASWLPNYYYHFGTEMTLLQRVRNALTPLQWFYSTNRVSYILPQLEILMRKSLNITEMPSVDELEKSSSLFLVNSHFIQEYPRSFPPFVVPVGGIHFLKSKQDESIAVSKALPQDISTFLDQYAENGFIYMSFGSLVEFSKAPSMVIEKFVNAFNVLDIPILWKWEDLEQIPKDSSEKIFYAKWFPQSLILDHPKLKVFITHGGILSYQEAMVFGVPLIVFPLTPEEEFNAVIIEKSITGIQLDISYFTQYEFATSVRKICGDETYKNNMIRLSQLFQDRPQSPVDTAVWWTEYVLRHKNLSFTKPLAINQSWYRRRLLDVWAFLSLIIISFLFVLVVSINYMFCKKSAPPPTKSTKHKHKSL